MAQGSTRKGVFFEDRGASITGDDAHLENDPHRPPHMQGSQMSRTPARLKTNCFKLTMLPSGSIYQLVYQLKPAATSVREERWVLQQIWEQLQQRLKGTFVVHFPGGYLFTPKPLDAEFNLEAPASDARGYPKRTVSVRQEKVLQPDMINHGACGPAQVVLQHVAKKLADGMMYQKVGRRYYNNDDATEGREGHSRNISVFVGFEMEVQIGKVGAHLVVNTAHRSWQNQSVIETIRSALPNPPLPLQERLEREEWQRRCRGATVVSMYNKRLYRLKGVRFDKKVTDTFSMYVRDEKVYKPMTYLAYYNYFYDKNIEDKDQPLLEAYPEKESETVLLVPELCALTGTSPELRGSLTKDEYSKTLDAIKVKPSDRLSAIREIVQNMSQGGVAAQKPAPGQEPSAAVLTEWNMSLDTQPVEVPAQVFPTLEVDFGAKAAKQFEIEPEGTFQRYMRNGVQASTKLTNWLLIYPEADYPVLEIWIRSLKDIAEVAFEMKLEFPQKHACDDQVNDIVPLLNRTVKPETQLVLLLCPSETVSQVYRLIKAETATRLPVVTQIVQSGTIRKRTQIAAVLSAIALQINAKCCGPLWQVPVKAELTKPYFETATMVVGIDVYRSLDGTEWLGFAASLDTHCTEYYSWATELKLEDAQSSEQGATSFRTIISMKLQQATAQALHRFAARNEQVLPSYIIVYRSSVRLSEEEAVRATEVEAVLTVLRATSAATSKKSGTAYEPKLTFVAITNSEGMRFFTNASGANAGAAADSQKSKQENPEPGTVVDSPVVSRSSAVNFWLINQSASKEKGTVAPTHYTVWYDTANVNVTALQNLTYRLSFLYFNIWMSIRLPAPAQYAKKVARHIGKYVKAEPNDRLVTGFFYL